MTPIIVILALSIPIFSGASYLKAGKVVVEEDADISVEIELIKK